MAKTETTVRGYVYTVTSPNGGTVTDAEGKLNKPVNAGDQVTVQAPSDSLTCDDDDAVIYKVNFKAPLLALRLLEQGKTALPAGYTPLEFLQSTGAQYIDSHYIPNDTTGLKGRYFRQDSQDTIEVGMRENTSAGTRFYLPRFGRSVGGGFGWGAWYTAGWLPSNVVQSQLNWLNGRRAEAEFVGDTFKFTSELPALPFEPTKTLFLFAANVAGSASLRCSCQMFELRISQGVEVKHIFIPALDPTGTPCMFDTVSKQPFRNAGSGQFVAGVGTVAQLTTLLRNLPATGGTLTLSLPAEANTPEVADMLQACHDTKGWTLTVHEYRPAAATTYSLRRVREVVWCCPSPCELGSYVDNFGTRWKLDRCAAIFGPHGKDPTAYGYTPFDSVEQAAEHWALQPYVDPEAMDEVMGDNGTLEQGGTENTSPET